MSEDQDDIGLGTTADWDYSGEGPGEVAVVLPNFVPGSHNSSRVDITLKSSRKARNWLVTGADLSVIETIACENHKALMTCLEKQKEASRKHEAEVKELLIENQHLRVLLQNSEEHLVSKPSKNHSSEQDRPKLPPVPCLIGGEVCGSPGLNWDANDIIQHHNHFPLRPPRPRSRPATLEHRSVKPRPRIGFVKPPASEMIVTLLEEPPLMKVEDIKEEKKVPPLVENRVSVPHSEHRVVFDMKSRIKAALNKPEIRIDMFYHKIGWCQYLAKSPFMEYLTLSVVAFNALWMSVDMELNEADVLLEAHPIFILAENCFCLFFFIEWWIRFFALKRKKDGVKDNWFIFDAVLLSFMVFETWILSLVIFFGGGGGGALSQGSLLKLLRLLRLARMSRMVKLLRALPELMVLVKGIVVATRSVFFTLCLLILIIYVFALLFYSLAKGSALEPVYFPSVYDSVLNLLIYCAIPDLGDIVKDAGAVNPMLMILLFMFILLASFTVLNMLVGILCEVVTSVSSSESELCEVKLVKDIILGLIEDNNIDGDGDHMISKVEFRALLEMPTAVMTLNNVGIDVVGLLDFEDIIFPAKSSELTFDQFMDTILDLRGSNTATVQTITDLRKHLNEELARITEKIDSVGITVGCAHP